ncbi:MAG TPA: FAD-binding oxidoreductase [Opitutus sp.]|nr:FAD-binding oxidoreductase [Opitutus sp.]
MHANILIVGQGLAGTLLAWELERAGVSFQIADLGHERAASRVAAGIINPITGQRIVKSWRVDTLLPLARESYRALEKELKAPVWQEMRVRRFYLDQNERRVLAEKQARGDLSEYAGATDGEGFWIEGAARVDTAALISAARARWLAAGRLREERVDFAAKCDQHELVIDCTGALSFGPAAGPAIEEGAGRSEFGFVPWHFSKGECLTVRTSGLAPDVVLNRKHWILPVGGGFAKVGATHVPARRDAMLTPEARAELESSAAGICRQSFEIVAHEAGVRTYVPDKKPVAGRHPENSRWGVLNGLGAKGALFAPMLAREWARHLVDRTPFDPEIDVARVWRPAKPAVSSP